MNNEKETKITLKDYTIVGKTKNKENLYFCSIHGEHCKKYCEAMCDENCKHLLKNEQDETKNKQTLSSSPEKSPEGS